MAKRKGGLGRGLNSLLGESANELSATEEVTKKDSDAEAGNKEDVSRETSSDKQAGSAEGDLAATSVLAIDKIVPNPDQPRTYFDEEELQELAASIERDGLLQPIVVRKTEEGYQIIAGERRWQASQKAGLKEVPIRLIEADDNKAMELALIENIQRSNLNPIEEAYGYKRLMEKNGMKQADIAKAVSKGRSTIANSLRLLELPDDAQQLLYDAKITAGHARAILSVPTEDGRKALTAKMIEKPMSVRDAESIARLLAGQAEAKEKRAAREPAPAYFKRTAKKLREKLSTNVRIKNAKGKNKVEIEFQDEEELKRIFKQLIGE